MILCGATTSGCVRASASTSCSTATPRSCRASASADRAQAPHEANLFDIQAKYADVVPLASVIDALNA